MARVILITGGSRSGKSAYAQRLAESISEERTYIATCPVVDDEMAARIRKHQVARRNRNWRTLEETMDIAAALGRVRGSPVILVDCLTLWVNNLLYESELQEKELNEEDIVGRCMNILDACDAIPGTVIFVTNEIGMGIVPDNAMSRRYRDLAGRCNQIVAGRSNAVILMVSGLPLNIKGEIIR